ncbi:zinc finger protein 654 [Spea bombifrons]|uniref:zinc finger protein 654 n=1 Tax=Spea bombifrons TaxID=233779 RepID=UPI0023495BC6|nr:zinc finger protein 654 [Spea bombifrons]
MAEDESDQESERLGEELEAIIEDELQGIASCELRSREYCRRFCEVVEEYTAQWQVPLPQLQVLQTALCCFTSASVSFPARCEHVQYVLSRLALSLFELLLFFGKDEFYEAPLKDILASVQECHDLLVRYDSTDLTLVTGVIKDGGPWEDPVLQAVLKGKTEPTDIVDRYLRSENPLFFELRVRYLIACERIPEAMALITTCLSHAEVSKNLYYHQAYFTCLHMAQLTDKLLHEHVRRIDCSDGVQIICDTEKEGKTKLAYQLSEAFLVAQLQSGEMYCIWDLIFVWSKLQLKINPLNQVFVEQCYQMLRIATNVKVIFPFMKAITEEIGETGVQLSVELCGCALQLDLNNDPETKSLIYKTIAYLLPTDLEICRICALSVFFLERTAESYVAVERLYKCSDEDYNEFTSSVENRVRFELLPILKRGLLFDPEFWNFSMIQENCASLLGEKAAIVLSDSSKLDDVAQENLPEEVSVTNLSNGTPEHNNSTNIASEAPADSKRNHAVLNPATNHNVPRHHCTLCNKEVLGGHIFRHAQAHQKKGCFSCVICARKFRNRVIMLKHLKNHIKKIQRQPIANIDGTAASDNPSHVSSDTTEVTSLDTTSLGLENGDSGNSVSKELADVPIANSTSQDDVPEPEIPMENHITNLSNHVTSIDHSEEDVTLGEVQQVEDGLNKDPSDCVKLNGSLCPSNKGHIVNREDGYTCPAEGCHRVFQKPRALNKHARKAHPADLNVQQYLMKWNKGKCRFCQRKFINSKHFVDHLKRHVYPNVYFCQHLNCNKSFKLATQLTEHVASHKCLTAQCGFINCTQVFDNLSSLYEHEAQHYVDSILLETATELQPTRSEAPGNAQDSVNTHSGSALAGGKKVQSVNDNEIVDLLVPGWKSRKDIPKPKTYTQLEKNVNEGVGNGDEDPQEIPEPKDIQAPVQESHPEEVTVVEKVFNGHAECDQTVTQVVSGDSTQNSPVLNNLSSSAPEVPQKVSTADDVESVPKPNSNPGTTSYGLNMIKPFFRPLPPSYLDERHISMPKRRKIEEGDTAEKDTACKASVERFRCGKCLTSYCSSEALEEHLAQKKCQLYFGFDSDDESAW